MKRWSASRLIATLIVCAAIVALIGLAALDIGSSGAHWPHGLEREFRVESVLNAALVGAALGAAGVAYQAVLRNPLADPYLLGVSSGASLAAYVWSLPAFFALAGAMGAFSQQLFAFLGALAAVVIVLALAGRRGRLEPVTLLLVGVIVNAIAGSAFLLINAIVRELPGTGGPLTFLVGGIQVIASGQRRAAAVIIALAWLVLLQLSGQLNVAGLDDAEAESLGVRVHVLRWSALVAASLMTAAAVAISGPIGFVGLICPHVGRLISGPDTRRLLPIATGLGAALLILADALSRYLAGENWLATQLPVGVLTGLLGGPFFLMLLFRNQRRLLTE